MVKFFIRIDSPEEDLMSSGEFIIKHNNYFFIVANHLIEIINDEDLYIINNDTCIEITGYNIIEDYYMGKFMRLKINGKTKNNDG